jgi:hypothetical protein
MVTIAPDVDIIIPELFYLLLKDVSIDVADGDQPHAGQAVEFARQAASPSPNARDGEANIVQRPLWPNA